MLSGFKNWIIHFLGIQQPPWVCIGEYTNKEAAEAFLLACYSKGFWVELREVRSSFNAITGMAAGPTLWMIDLRSEEVKAFEQALKVAPFLSLEGHWVSTLSRLDAEKNLKFPLYLDAENRHMLFHWVKTSGAAAGGIEEASPKGT
ncbi:MAG: hypothetical protein O3C32_06140 [Bacteroidetes bacterium]|jgi:hypothetical protein|nr:hypothetical protein [Bacteroidota bacterium]